MKNLARLEAVGIAFFGMATFVVAISLLALVAGLFFK